MAEDLSKRKMIKGKYVSGKYSKQKAKGRKVAGLTKKQVAAGRRVGKAGRSTITKKESKAAAKNIDISQTRWKAPSERTGPRAKGGIVVDKSGKPITGTVKMANGRTATYVRGKRVTYKAKPASRGRGGGTGGSGGKTTGPYTSAGPKKGGGQGPGKPKPKPMWYGANKPITRGEPPNRVQGMSRPRPGNNSVKPKRGARKSVRRGDFVITYEWDGTRWTQAKQTRVTG